MKVTFFALTSRPPKIELSCSLNFPRSSDTFNTFHKNKIGKKNWPQFPDVQHQYLNSTRLRKLKHCENLKLRLSRGA